LFQLQLSIFAGRIVSEEDNEAHEEIWIVLLVCKFHFALEASAEEIGWGALL
jgi:hypothetical protein